ncbi:TLD-domain-containing protein [Zychaea mexicana]|uniref:TLD-domain-containing protein n=1 Tax=Zychaea mexicana TaxID=64656 RepID=UPI0022FE444F|nr:TLD-domain-containing protein [Zychaea mexicana]KAI9499727.1 TLD-domain-containing protein [Zychaea mexicana]
MVRRSSTGLFSSLSLSTSTSTVSTASTASSSSASSDEDEEQVNDDEREQKKSILSAATATQYPSIKLTQRLPHTSGCLDVNMAERLRSHFPSRVAVCSEWSLLYSMDQHGASLQTMYRQLSQHHGPCVLVIQTIDDEIFGAYLSEPVHVQSRYYGSGECFLWRLDSSSSVLPLDIYRWTGKNDYLCYSARDYISMGGGDGRVAIWLDEDLLQGHTESCATFDNKPLATSSKFECLALEVWGFRY